jgi:hypothetical protein
MLPKTYQQSYHVRRLPQVAFVRSLPGGAHMKSPLGANNPFNTIHYGSITNSI